MVLGIHEATQIESVDVNANEICTIEDADAVWTDRVNVNVLRKLIFFHCGRKPVKIYTTSELLVF